MVLLLSASWILILSLIVSLCVTARNGDLPHPPTSPPLLGGPQAVQRCGPGGEAD